MFKGLLQGALLAIEVIVGIALVNVGEALVSDGNDFTVMIGIALILATFVCGIYAMIKTGKALYKTMEGKGVGGVAAIAAIILMGMSNTACTTISPGTVGIKVSNYGSQRGVQDYTLQTGMVWFMPGVSRVFEYPTFVQTVKWTATQDEGSPRNEEFVFNSKDAAVIKADISLSYQLDPKKVPAFYVKFRSDNLDDFTNGFLHNIARDAFQEEAVNYTALELYGEKKDIFLKSVQQHIAQQVDSLGVEITQFGLMGNLRLPEEITTSVVAKIAATQNAIKAQNEVAQATAQAQSAVAKARGESEANRLLTQSLSSQLIQWRALDIQGQAVAKWNGTLPQFTTGNGIPLIQMPQQH